MKVVYVNCSWKRVGVVFMGDQARRVGRMTRGQLATVRFFFPFLRCMCAVLFFLVEQQN
jgi:hypothetical protein